MNASERLPAQADLTLRSGLIVEQRIHVIRIAVPPAVDGYGLDVPLRVEPACSEDPRQLVAGAALEHIERQRKGNLTTGAPGAAQVADRAVRPRHVQHVQDHRLLGAARELVLAETYRVVELDAAVETGG